LDLNDDDIEWILDFDISSGSEAGFCCSDDQNSDDDDICIGTMSRQKYFETEVETNDNIVPQHILDLLGNINSEIRFYDTLPVGGCVVMNADYVDSYKNFIKNIKSEQQNPIHSVMHSQIIPSTYGNTSSPQLLKNSVKRSTRKLKTKNIKGEAHTIVLPVKKRHTNLRIQATFSRH